MVETNGTTVAKEYVFDDYIPTADETEDDKKLCAEWVLVDQVASLATLAIPGVIGSINVGVEIIIGYGSEYISRPRNYQKIILEAMSGICGIQFINLGVLFVLISINSENFLNDLGVL